MREYNHSDAIIPVLSAVETTSDLESDSEYSQPKDAVVYVTVVLVFYAAIIMFLIGSNIRRRRFKIDSEDGFHYEEFVAQREAILENEKKARKLQTGSSQFKLFRVDEKPVFSEI